MRFDVLRERYALADRISKSVSLFGDEVAIPAINELRYAGYHLLQALGENGSLENSSHIDQAIEHCDRAIYDATEVGIIALAQRISKFLSYYRSVAMREAVRDLPEIRKTVRFSMTILSDGQKRSTKERVDIYDKLVEASKAIDDAKPDLDQLAYVDRRSRFRFVVSSVLVALGISLGLLFSL